MCTSYFLLTVIHCCCFLFFFLFFFRDFISQKKTLYEKLIFLKLQLSLFIFGAPFCCHSSLTILVCRRYLHLARVERGTRETCGRWCATGTSGPETIRSCLGTPTQMCEYNIHKLKKTVKTLKKTVKT